MLLYVEQKTETKNITVKIFFEVNKTFPTNPPFAPTTSLKFGRKFHQQYSEFAQTSRSNRE